MPRSVTPRGGTAFPQPTELFRASHKLNIDCKNAIETAIRENFDGMRLKKTCLRPVLEEFGADRMNWVLPEAYKLALRQVQRYLGLNFCQVFWYRHK